MFYLICTYSQKELAQPGRKNSTDASAPSARFSISDITARLLFSTSPTDLFHADSFSCASLRPCASLRLLPWVLLLDPVLLFNLISFIASLSGKGTGKVLGRSVVAPSWLLLARFPLRLSLHFLQLTKWHLGHFLEGGTTDQTFLASRRNKVLTPVFGR